MIFFLFLLFGVGLQAAGYSGQECQLLISTFDHSDKFHREIDLLQAERPRDVLSLDNDAIVFFSTEDHPGFLFPDFRRELYLSGDNAALQQILQTRSGNWQLMKRTFFDAFWKGITGIYLVTLEPGPAYGLAFVALTQATKDLRKAAAIVKEFITQPMVRTLAEALHIRRVWARTRTSYNHSIIIAIMPETILEPLTDELMILGWEDGRPLKRRDSPTDIRALN